MLREQAENLITLLRVDLRLADTCKRARETLLAALSNQDIFAKQLTDYFASDAAAQQQNFIYNIPPHDPAQVAVLKKILNALTYAQNAFKKLEALNVQRDRYLIGIARDLSVTGYEAVHELYAAVQLINHSSADIQTIVGPYINALLPKLNIAKEAFEQTTPNAGEYTAKALAAAIGYLPTQEQAEADSLAVFTKLIFEMPTYFEALQKQIATGTSGITLKSTTTAEGYKEVMLRRANNTKQHFEALAKNHGGISGIAKYTATVKELANYGSELMTTAAPVTKEAYLAAVEKLNQIRHEILPGLISELEEIEENLALKRGILVAPVLEQMQGYYQQLAANVNGIANAAGVIDSVADLSNALYTRIATRLIGARVKPDAGKKLEVVANLDKLQDDEFKLCAYRNRVERLGRAKFESQDQSKIIAATAFFNKLANLSWWAHKWSLANTTPDMKAALTKEYKQFQAQFAALYPQLDKLIVHALQGNNDDASYWQSLTSNQFKTIMECQKNLLESLEQSIAQARFNADLIQAENVGDNVPQFYADGEEKAREYSRARGQIETTDLIVMGDAVEKRTLFGQLKGMQLSATLDAFLKQQTPDVRLPYTNLHKDTPDERIQKQFINSLYHLKVALIALESLDGKDPGNVVTRGYYMNSLLTVVSSLVAVKHVCIEAAQNPGLNTIVTAALEAIGPLQNIPIIGDYLKFTPPTMTEEQPLDVVAAWKAEQRVVRHILNGEPLVEATAPAPEPEVEPEDDEFENITNDSYLHTIKTIADYLFDVPVQLQSVAGNDEIVEADATLIAQQKQDFIASLSELSWGPGSFANIIVAIQKSTTQLLRIGKESRDLAYRIVTNLPKVVGETLIAFADTTEFNLGFDKPGEISTVLVDQFNNFYFPLVESMAFGHEQQRLELLNSTKLTAARIEKEKARHEKLVGEHTNKEGEAAQFVMELHVFNDLIKQGFTQDDVKVQFLRTYAKFQPRLAQINAKYDLSNFLRSLSTPEAFTSAANDILRLRGSLDELIVSDVVRQNQKEIQRCVSRIVFFEQQQEREEEEGRKRIDAFTARMSHNFLDEHVRVQYEQVLGPYANVFYEKIKVAYDLRCTELLKSITLEEDVQSEVTARIQQLCTEIVTEHLELLDAYTVLNLLRQKINEAIAAEAQNNDTNPCRNEKLQKLTAENERLVSQGILSELRTIADLENDIKQTGQLVAKIKEYNTMIKLFDMLQDMENYIAQQPQDEITFAKTNELKSIKTILQNPLDEPSLRLQAVKTRGLSNDCKDILLKNSDNAFIKLLKFFWTLLTGRQSQDQVNLGMFRAKLNEPGEIPEIVPGLSPRTVMH